MSRNHFHGKLTPQESNLVKTLDYLILAAHPDDAELYCGGTIARMCALGYRVGVLDLTRGEAATTGTVEERVQETAAANEILKLTWRANLGLPDSGLQDSEAMRAPLVRVIREQRPKIMIAPLGPCRHPDHTATYELAKSCHFFAGAGGYPCELAPYRPAKLFFHLEVQDVKPSFVIDISDYYDQKKRAIEAYKSQFASGKTYIGSSGFHAMMEARFAYYGGQVGCAYGEPYVSHDLIRLDNPLNLISET